MKTSVKTICGLFVVLAAVFVFVASCSDGNADSMGNNNSGQGGSMARFTINGDFLYTVDNEKMNIVSLMDPAQPYLIEDVKIGRDIETIFTMSDYLFIGSREAMYIYDVSNPSFPERMSATSHFRSCDPVVADGNYAFVTLNSTSGQWCNNNVNEFLVYNIADITNPILIHRQSLESPRGLAVDGQADLLFVCDDGAVKAYDISDMNDIRGKFTSSINPDVRRIDAYDCIASNGTLFVIGADGFYQLGYDRDGFTLISKIDLRSED
jgi:hypothetical protein